MTYRASTTLLQKENDLLPWGQRTQVDGGEPAHGDSADTVEQRVDVRDLRGPITGIEYAREDQRREGAVERMNVGAAVRC